MQSVTFSGTATALSAMTQLNLGGSPTYHGGTANVRVFATSTGTGAAASIELVLVEKGVRLATFPAVVTPTAYRTDAAGTGGGYVCTVAFTEGGTSKFDPLGAYAANGLSEAGLSGDDAGAAWLIGCSGLGDTTALTLRFATTEVL